MSEPGETTLPISARRRRRGVAKASITRLSTRLIELETKVDDPSTLGHAQKLSAKLESLDSEFKVHHFAIVDALEDDEHLDLNLAKEQDELDIQDAAVSDLSLRLESLIRTCSSQTDTAAHRIASRRLTNLRERLSHASSELGRLSGAPGDADVVDQYREQTSDHKKELSDIRDYVLATCGPSAESDALVNGPVVELERLLFDVSLTVKRKSPKTPAARTSDAKPAASSEAKMVRLPKLDIPTFDGNLLHWLTFWEQFCVAIHDRDDISDAQKLVYLRQSLKDGSARNAIEGLSRSGEQYKEAIQCLQNRYNRPRMIHQAHVRKIVEAPSLKDSTGRELRRLHDVLQQHLRALKAMGKEPPAAFITSLIEMKLDPDTRFEWQKSSQGSVDVPPYAELLEFLNLRAQASESATPEQRRQGDSRKYPQSKASSFTSSAYGTNNCVISKTEKHPLYACTRLKSLSHDKMIETLKFNDLCMNCLRPGHFSRQCTSLSKCRKCQKPHHTLIHIETKTSEQSGAPTLISTVTPTATSNTATGFSSNTLLMTCQVLIHSPDGTSLKARALLDSASSTSFVSERLTQALRLPKSSQRIRITGIAGISHRSSLHSVVNFDVSSMSSEDEKIAVSAVAVPRVTNDLPLQPVPLNASWSHLSDLPLADTEFGRPGKVDLLLGADVYGEVMLHGRRSGPRGTPAAFETKFGWVLAGKTKSSTLSPHSVISHHVSVVSGDELLSKFWQMEEAPNPLSSYSHEERLVMQRFKENHRKSDAGRFIVPLPRKPQAKAIGESRNQAVRRFLTLERSLNTRSQFQEFSDVVEEYFEMKHAELVPATDLQKPVQEVFYLPMHAVRKEHSTTTKLRVVFDASAKSTSGTSLNDTLLVGPTVHPPLLDVLLRFRSHRVAVTADVSKMYRAVELTPEDRDYHRFVWRSDPNQPLKDYRMMRVTFGVSASSFAVNMSVKQNAHDNSTKYPLAAEAVEKSFYVDDCLTGADTVPAAIELRRQLQELFNQGGFLLRKWNASEPAVLANLSPDLKDPHSTQLFHDTTEYTKTLGIEWDVKSDEFHLTIAKLPALDNVTKRLLVSDVAKTFDVLGWFSPSIVKAKILLQRVWEAKVDWDDPIPSPIQDAWLHWRSELHLLSEKSIPRCYFHKTSDISSFELHGFCDASEHAYAAVVYLRLTDSQEDVQVSLVSSKTKVAPIKRLTIPRLELCGAYLLAHLLHHVRQVLEVPLSRVHAWTDSTIVLNWLDGSPRRFKTFVGNRISTIMELVHPDKWSHVSGLDNPADCASRGLFPSELVPHPLWWGGPSWLKQSPADWPKQTTLLPNDLPEEEREISLLTTVADESPIIPLDRYSSFSRLKRVTAWVLRFINNCRKHTNKCTSPLSTRELKSAEHYWIKNIQSTHFQEELASLKKQVPFSSSSPLLSLRPFVDSSGLLRVGGRRELGMFGYESKHPIILAGKHPLTKLLIRTEHLRLLHAGPTLLMSTLSQRFHIVGGRNVIRSITRACVICRRNAIKPQPQMLGQLPIERITPGPIFDKVGVDYAGPVFIKYGHTRKPTIVKAYVCVFVSLTVKAVHLELVSDLTTEAFIACLRRFVSRRGAPSLIWSDHGSNFVGAARELKSLFKFLRDQKTQHAISDFLSTRGITWKFIPPQAPHFGGIWEAAVKSMKTHLKKIVGNVKLTFEEFSTLLTQVEACLNSRPLTPLDDDDGIEALTPGHFLIGRPLQALPDDSFAYADSISSLRRWKLCQTLLSHFWKRWSREYLTQLGRFTKWRHPTRNITVGDLVILRDDSPLPTKWPLARVVEVHPGKDALVRVATIRTSTGIYTRPVTKLALLLPSND